MGGSVRRWTRRAGLAGAVLLTAAGSGAAQEGEPVRVFLDCPSFCDETHVRNEVDWIDWVRDREDSQVHVLVSTRTTGSGGREYTVAFIGRGPFEGVGDEIVFATSGDATQDERREEFLSALVLGLGRYVARTPGRRRVRMQLRGAGPGPGPGGGAPAGRDPADDPWDFWVFNVGVNGNASGESRQTSSSYSGSVGANRTTEAWKINARGRYSRRESTFELTDTSVTSVVESWSASGLLVRSLGDHWSVGSRAEAGSSTFTNQEFSWSVNPGIEYSVFPYDESTRRSLTIQYLLGLNHWDYDNETIYGLTEETRPTHQLAAGLDLVQPWGQTSISVSGLQYLHDTSFYRVDLFGSLNVRLFRGFSFQLFGSYAWVADQLYIPAGDLSDEDILLQIQARETNRRYFTSFGISYRFGSIFNNVVNPRFGGGGGGGMIFF